MFEQLVLVDHPNIVKLHKYWLDVKDSKARVGRTQGDKVSGGGMAVGTRRGSQLCSSHRSPGLPFLPWDTVASSALSRVGAGAGDVLLWPVQPWAAHGAGSAGRLRS